MWGELPAAASGGSAALPTLAPVGLKDRVFQLEQVNADLNTNEATLRLRLVEGPRYPVPELEVFLILEDGEIIAPEETLNDTTDHSSH